MSPELLFPEEFGLEYIQPTKASDCCALGMVFYEVLSGKRPFDAYKRQPTVCVRVLRGERPDRPQGVGGVWVTDEAWKVLEHCWKPTPDDRPSIASILQRLKEWTSPSPRMLALAGPPSSSSDPSTAGGMEEDQAPSLLRVTPSQSLRTFLPQGDPSDPRIHPFSDELVVLHHRVPGNRDPETDDKGLKEPGEIQDRVSCIFSGDKLRANSPVSHHLRAIVFEGPRLENEFPAGDTEAHRNPTPLRVEEHQQGIR